MSQDHCAAAMIPQGVSSAEVMHGRELASLKRERGDEDGS